MGEWPDLMVYVEDNIGGFKAQAFLFSRLFNFSFDFWYYHLLVFAIVNRVFYICVDL
jgi:hypothetical protein